MSLNHLLTMLRSFIDINMPVIYFIYGLVFFSSGIIIVVQYRQSGAFSFGKNLWLLGVFALLHSVSEWGYLFIPVQELYLVPDAIHYLYTMRNLLGAVSFFVLLLFALRMLLLHSIWLTKVIPLAAFAIWLGIFIFNFSHSEQSALLSETLARYMLSIPSGLLTALAFFRQSKHVQEVRFAQEMKQSLQALSLVFLFYAFFAGVIVPNEPFFPANVVNTAWFYYLTDMPVQVFRATCGLFMMIYTFKLLGTFNQETEYLVLQAKEEVLRKSERERISRDLHDGVIQTLYAAQLMIENSLYKLEPDSSLRSDLNSSMKTLDQAMLDLRGYIKGLRDEFFYKQPLQEMMNNILGEFRDYALNFELEFRANPNLEISVYRQNHLYHIIKELLNNVAKHSRATQVHIKVLESKRKITIVFTDNGIGIPKECLEPAACKGMGLRHIHERMAILRGEINFWRPQHGGTVVNIDIPKEI